MFIFCRDIDFHVNEIIKNMRCCDVKKDDDFIDIDERYSHCYVLVLWVNGMVFRVGVNKQRVFFEVSFSIECKQNAFFFNRIIENYNKVYSSPLLYYVWILYEIKKMIDYGTYPEVKLILLCATYILYYTLGWVTRLMYFSVGQWSFANWDSFYMNWTYNRGGT